MTQRIYSVSIALFAFLVTVGCDGKKNEQTPVGGAAPATEAPKVSNRIDLPEKVRQNLGITFAKAERRRVASTIRVPGRFELLPSARREYRAMLPGRVELLVSQYQAVSIGQVLARLDSPEWRRVQHEATEAEGEIKVALAQFDVAKATVEENTQAAERLARRLGALAEANTRNAELESELASLKGKTKRLEAEQRAAQVKTAEAEEHYQSKLRTLSSIVDIPVARLLEPAPRVERAPPGEAEPLWRTITAIELRASAPGVVEMLAVTAGGWVETAGLVLATVDPAQIRFRAVGLQADIGILKQGAAASIVPPAGAGAEAKALTGTLALGIQAQADTRTIDLLVTPESAAPWARAGVSTFAEIVTNDSTALEPAIPVAAVIQDDLAKIFFRRDPNDPNKVIRVEGDFGVSDGLWIVVNSGLKAGDEVVMDGVYELKLTGGGKASGGGGHFHADGTWHADGAPEPGTKK